ncbi:MAG TPA: SHOCT domain-containing protein [Streptosporangiaceae bacterium]|jgi:membrane protease subunit (stomatin/prohibitin family)
MPFRRRPLLRTAMIGGAGMLAGRAAANRSQQNSEQDERLANVERQQAQASQAQSVPAQASAGHDDLVAQLSQLKQLADSGALTQAEYDTAKQKLLAG